MPVWKSKVARLTQSILSMLASIAMASRFGSTIRSLCWEDKGRRESVCDNESDGESFVCRLGSTMQHEHGYKGDEGQVSGVMK